MTPKELSLKSYCLQIGVPELNAKHLDRFDRIYDAGRMDGVKEGIANMRKEMGIDHGVYPLVPEPGYEKLVGVLKQAHDHAAHGKGKERHANDLPFHEQRMLSIARLLKSPPDALAYQVCKKVAEGLTLPEHNRKVAELIGAINYIAGIVILLEEERDKLPPKSEMEQMAEDMNGVEFKSARETYVGDLPNKAFSRTSR